MDDLAATVLDDLDIWTDVAVPLVAPIIGGGFRVARSALGSSERTVRAVAVVA